jgi:hypothetical protein
MTSIAHAEADVNNRLTLILCYYTDHFQMRKTMSKAYDLKTYGVRYFEARYNSSESLILSSLQTSTEFTSVLLNIGVSFLEHYTIFESRHNVQPSELMADPKPSTGTEGAQPRCGGLRVDTEAQV